MKQQRNIYVANVVERVEEVAEKKSPQDKYTNDQIVNSLSTEQLRKIGDILQFSNEKEKSNGNEKSSIQTFEKGNESSVQTYEKGKVCTNFWILDIGATDHVSCDLTLFLSHHEIKPIRSRLPNNTHVIARCARIVLLLREFMIHNVLYILEFTLNILSIHSFASSLNYKLTFSRDLFDIQEMSTSK